MLSWWSDLETVALLANGLLVLTVIFAMITTILSSLQAKRSKEAIDRLSVELESSKKQVKTLEKTAEEIRRELLQTQQHQDINQLKLKTSKSSAHQLREALVDAQKRLAAAKKAVREHEEKAAQQLAHPDGGKETPDLERNVLLDPSEGPEKGLPASRREQLIDLLDPGPKGTVDIFCVLENETSVTTANQLASILSADGWKTSSVTRSAFTKPPSGIVLAVNSKETAPSYASFLQRVFTTIGMPVSARIDKKYREWSLTIVVGTFDEENNG